jgi:hypothetical protein
VSELVRMAAAALISLYVYLNFKQGPNDLAAGEQQDKLLKVSARAAE